MQSNKANNLIEINPNVNFQRLFKVAFVLMFIAGCGKFTEEIFGFALQARFTLRPAILFLLLAAIALGIQSKLSYFNSRTRFTFTLLVLFSLYLFIKGLVLEHPYGFIMTDIEPVVFLITGIVIGGCKTTWPMINKLFVRSLFFGSILNIIAMLKFISLSRAETYNSLAYEIQYLIWPSLFFIITLPYQANKRYRWVIIVSFLIYIFEQLAFQKRLPIALGGISFLFYLYFSGNYMNKRPKLFYVLFVLIGAFFIGVISWQVLKVFGLDLNYSVEAFIDRLFSDDEDTSTSFENGRFFSAMVVFNSIRGFDIISGQGFGAYSTSLDLWWNLQTDKDLIGVSIIEVGQVWPYWKGGVFYWLLFNSFSVVPILNSSNSKFQIVCKYFVFFMFFAYFSQSFAGSQRMFTMLWGLAAGMSLIK